MKLAGVALLGCASACVGRLDSPFPELEAKSAVELFHFGDRDVARVVRLEGPLERLDPLFAEDAVEITIVAESCDPDSLGLVEELQELEAEERAEERSGSNLLPPGTVLHFTQGRDWETSSLGELPRSSALLSRLPLPDDNLCRISTPSWAQEGALIEFDPELDGAEVAFATALDGERALVGTEDGPMYVVTRRGERSAIADLPRFRAVDAAARDGQAWVVSTRAELAAGPVDQLRLVVRSSEPGYLETRVAVSAANAPLEVYAVTSTKSLLELDEAAGRWVTIHESESEWAPVRPSVAWVGPGEVIAVGPTARPSKVLWWKDGAAHELALPTDHGNARIVAVTPRLGPIVVAETGRIFKLQPFELVPLSDSPVQARVGRLDVLPIGAGFLELRYAEVGAIAWYHPIAGFCPVELELGSIPTAVTLLGDDALVAYRTQSRQAYVALNRAVRTVPTCLAE